VTARCEGFELLPAARLAVCYVTHPSHVYPQASGSFASTVLEREASGPLHAYPRNCCSVARRMYGGALQLRQSVASWTAREEKAVPATACK
jgi:hypothetical protein